MKFDDYSIASGIKKSLNKANFTRPTDIQFKSIPPILKGEDVLAIAQTGTGKTAAFAIPVIHVIHQKKITKPITGIQCVVMVPTRELAIQINDVFIDLCKHTKVSPMCVFGGVEQDPQIEKLNKGVDILVATPGRLFDLVSQKHIDLNNAGILILDEADHMLDLGFIKDINDLIWYLPKKRQTLFFSATINDKIKKLAYSLVHKPIRIQISPKDPVAKNINHSVAFIKMDDKRFFLERLIHENPDMKILVFVRTKVRAERVMKAMERVNIESKTIHSGKEQKDRMDVMSDYRSGKLKVLIATDVSARGIDIPNVDYVVNYDLPEQVESYVHRVGRTGRGKNKGLAISFCSDEEKDILTEIEQYVHKSITVLKVEKGSYQETIDLTSDTDNNWKALIDQSNVPVAKVKKKKRKKK